MRVVGRAPASGLRRDLLWLLALAVVAAVALLSASEVSLLRWLPRRGPVAEPSQTLRVDLPFEDYSALLEQRDRALAAGVVLTQVDDFLPAVVRVDDEVVDARLRLVEGPTDRLGADGQWPFEVRVRDEATLLGMQRFSLLAPEAVGGEARIALNRAMRHEGILVAPISWVRLVFNGDDRGVYAMQAGLTDALPASQDRPGGVVLGFDADRFWQQVAGFQGDLSLALADPILELEGLHYLEADAFGDTAIERDPLLEAQRDAALAQLHHLQARTRPAGEVVNVDRYARFLALVDLWGLPQLASPLNLGLAYEPESGLLEPVAAGGGLGAWTDTRLDLGATYGDPHVQVAYARAATRMSSREYLDELRSTLGDGTDPALWDSLAERQALILGSLTPARPVFAYLAEPTKGTFGVLRVGIANVTRLPLEIQGFDINGLLFIDMDPGWQLDGQALRLASMDGVVLQAYSADDGIRYAHFDIPLTATLDDRIDPNEGLDVSVVARVAGAEDNSLTPVPVGLPSLLMEAE